MRTSFTLAAAIAIIALGATHLSHDVVDAQGRARSSAQPKGASTPQAKGASAGSRRGRINFDDRLTLPCGRKAADYCGPNAVCAYPYAGGSFFREPVCMRAARVGETCGAYNAEDPREGRACRGAGTVCVLAMPEDNEGTCVRTNTRGAPCNLDYSELNYCERRTGLCLSALENGAAFCTELASAGRLCGQGSGLGAPVVCDKGLHCVKLDNGPEDENFDAQGRCEKPDLSRFRKLGNRDLVMAGMYSNVTDPARYNEVTGNPGKLPWYHRHRDPRFRGASEEIEIGDRSTTIVLNGFQMFRESLLTTIINQQPTEDGEVPEPTAAHVDEESFDEEEPMDDEEFSEEAWDEDIMMGDDLAPEI